MKEFKEREIEREREEREKRERRERGKRERAGERERERERESERESGSGGSKGAHLAPTLIAASYQPEASYCLLLATSCWLLAVLAASHLAPTLLVRDETSLLPRLLASSY